MARYTAKVIKVAPRTKYLPASYNIDVYFAGTYLTSYTRHGRSAAYEFKRYFESTGICPRS